MKVTELRDNFVIVRVSNLRTVARPRVQPGGPASPRRPGSTHRGPRDGERSHVTDDAKHTAGLVDHFFRHEYGRLVAQVAKKVGVRHVALSKSTIGTLRR